MAAGLAGVQQLEITSRFHRRSANDLLCAAKDMIPRGVAAAFKEVSRAANAAKHASFLRPTKKHKKDLPATSARRTGDLELPCLRNHDCDHVLAFEPYDRELLLKSENNGGCELPNVARHTVKEKQVWLNDPELLSEAEHGDLLLENRRLNETLSEWIASW